MRFPLRKYFLRGCLLLEYYEYHDQGEIMLIQKIFGIIFIFWGLGCIFFAKRIFDFFAQRSGAKMLGIERWPDWMFRTYPWGIRIGGIFLLIIGLSIVFNNR
jgi:hypothetical protein